MKRGALTVAILLGGLILGFQTAASAQDSILITFNGESTRVDSGWTLGDLVRSVSSGDGIEVTHNGREIDARDLDGVSLAEGDRVEITEAKAKDDDEHTRFGFGFGFGLVSLRGDEATDDVSEYLTAHMRFAIGDPDSNRSRGRQGGGLRGFLEPEIGYWETDDNGLTVSDLLIGVNLVGVIPFDAMDFFVGAGLGLHFFDADLSTSAGTLSESDEVLGANAHFGVDIHMTDTMSLYGVGRFDLVDDTIGDGDQAKAFVGLRFVR